MIDVIQTTAELFGITRDDLVGPSRARHIVEARQAAAYALRQRFPSMSLCQIGQLVGRKDHTTILHALQRAEQRAVANYDYALRLSALLGR